jgi:hypothetical protein
MASALYIAAFFIAAMALLVIIFKRIHNQQQLRKTTAENEVFEHAVGKHSFQVSEKERVNQYLFAIDTANAQLLYINYQPSQQQALHVDLLKVKAVKTEAEESSAYELRKGKKIAAEKHVISLDLLMTMKDPGQPPTRLPIYQYEDGLENLSTSKIRGAYWQGLINKNIRQ